MSGMHLLGPAYSTTNTRKRKAKKKTARQLQAEKEHQAFLKKHGVDDASLKNKLYQNGKRKSVNDIPTYDYQSRQTSDQIAGNGTAKDRKKYTGNEIAGIALNHKSNYEPIRKDNMQAAIDSANMRR